jgi:hypothetical protein
MSHAGLLPLHVPALSKLESLFRTRVRFDFFSHWLTFPRAGVPSKMLDSLWPFNN